MKKKVFSLMAVVLFMSSSLNVKALSSFESNTVDCFNYANKTAKRNAFLQGWSHEQEFTAFEALYDDCMDQ